jgi:hypothetical protein
VADGFAVGIKNHRVAATIADDRIVASIQQKPPSFVFLDQFLDRFTHLGRSPLFGAFHGILLLLWVGEKEVIDGKLAQNMASAPGGAL